MATDLGKAFKVALVRGIRTLLQTFAGALIALPIVANVADIKANAPALVVATYIAFMAGLVAFIQNFSENL